MKGVTRLYLLTRIGRPLLIVLIFLWLLPPNVYAFSGHIDVLAAIPAGKQIWFAGVFIIPILGVIVLGATVLQRRTTHQ